MKQNREAGEGDEAGAPLAFFCSAEMLRPAVVFSLSLHVRFNPVGFVLQQTWLLLPVRVFYI